ncbi:hepatic lectin-like [Saccostrea echinata]|uniref:hepatic lectin-like n=1 Tax=Saccostrea echinata TaxID=191078 RepID=UPI002A7F1106|nr:hepatic lectin-like [Saccostrea echinata]
MLSGWGYWSGLSICDPGWFQFEDHCYFKSKEKLTWSNARLQCERGGGYLVEIESMKENDWIINKLTPAQCTIHWILCVIWIGATDQEVDGQFIWDGSREKLNFINWRSGEPNNYQQQEDCAVVNYPSGEWCDFPCSDKHYYICEKKL